MLISFVTVIECPQFLIEVYRSLQSQAHVTWEWLIAVRTDVVIPTELLQDPRVRVVTSDSSPLEPGIWASLLGLAHGEAVGVLQDGCLLSYTNCLTHIKEAITDCYDFVYGDVAVVGYEFNRIKIIEPPSVWQIRSYNVSWLGETLSSRVTYPLSCYSLLNSNYSPQGLLLWRRQALESLRGFRTDIETNPTQDLIVRTFLADQHTYRIQQCLCVMFTGDPADRQNRQHQQKKVDQLVRRDYFEQMLSREASKYGRQTVDVTLSGLQAIQGLKSGFEIGRINCRGFLHQLELQDVFNLLEDAYDILSPGGVLQLKFPVSGLAEIDTNRKNQISPAELQLMLSRHWLKQHDMEGLFHYQWLGVSHEYPSTFHARRKLEYATVTLSAVKDDTQPGFLRV